MKQRPTISWIKARRATSIAAITISICVAVETYGLWQESGDTSAASSNGHSSILVLEMPKDSVSPPVDIEKQVLERPLFVQGRRLGVAQAKSAAPPLDAPKATREFKLVAVELTRDQRIAIFSETGSDPIRLAETDTLDGWTIVSVSRDHVELKRGDEMRQLYLSDSTPPTTTLTIAE